MSSGSCSRTNNKRGVLGMHVLITGGAGFIGSNLAEFHLGRGDKVHVVDDLSTGSLQNIASFLPHSAFRFDQADILTWAGLAQAVEWADRIYHMAAVVGVRRVLADPVKVMSTNMAGTERVLRAVHGGGWNPQVLVASSSEVYAFNPKAVFAETDDVVLRSGGRLRWSYAVTKLADEFLAFSYARHYGLDIKIVRLFNTTGPNQTGAYGMVVPNFIRQAVRGEAVTVFGDGRQTRSFCDVRDTVAMLDALCERPEASGEIVNVGNDQEIPIGELARLIIARAGSTSEILTVPYREAYGEEFEDVTHRRPDLTKLRALTGFTPQWTLESTIDDLIRRERMHVPD